MPEKKNIVPPRGTGRRETFQPIGMSYKYAIHTLNINNNRRQRRKMYVYGTCLYVWKNTIATSIRERSTAHIVRAGDIVPAGLIKCGCLGSHQLYSPDDEWRITAHGMASRRVVSRRAFKADLYLISLAYINTYFCVRMYWYALATDIAHTERNTQTLLWRVGLVCPNIVCAVLCGH